MKITRWLLEMVLPGERITHLSGGDADILAIPLILGIVFMFAGVLKALGLLWGGKSLRSGLIMILAGLVVVVGGTYYLVNLLPERPHL